MFESAEEEEEDEESNDDDDDEGGYEGSVLDLLEEFDLLSDED